MKLSPIIAERLHVLYVERQAAKILRYDYQWLSESHRVACLPHNIRRTTREIGDTKLRILQPMRTQPMSHILVDCDASVEDHGCRMEAPQNYYVSDESALAQQARLTDWIWEGSTVIELTGTVAQLFPQIPVFSRHPFRVGDQENRFKDEIWREPLKITEEPVPIATVSKSYSLIQHRDVLASVFRALKMIEIDISGVQSSTLMSEYGERMQWSCPIPNMDFNPGDGHPLVLRINCLNSVDTSTVLEITFSWFRLVCANGLMFDLGDSRLRRRHIRSQDPQDVASYLKEQLDQRPAEQTLYREWNRKTIDSSRLIGWIDEKVAKEWGPHAAARTWKIIREGLDGEVEQTRDLKPHQLPVKPTTSVPGASAPADNLYHVSQALSWIAGTRKSMQDRLEYVKAIPKLMEPLIEQKQTT